MLAFGIVQVCLGLRNRVLAPLALLSPRGFLIPALFFAFALLPLQRTSGFAGCPVIDFASRRRF